MYDNSHLKKEHAKSSHTKTHTTNNHTTPTHKMCASAASFAASDATDIYNSKHGKQEVSGVVNNTSNNNDASNNDRSNNEDKDTEADMFLGMPGTL